MSENLQNSPDRYYNPTLIKKQSTLYNYDKKQIFGNTETFSQLQCESIITEYPRTAYHARHPIMISCNHCQKITMTETEQQFGASSFVWCILLLPIFCMGMCCLCSPTCKDVKHICRQCRHEVGISKSSVC